MSIYEIQKQLPGLSQRPTVSEPDPPKGLEFPLSQDPACFLPPVKVMMKAESVAQSSEAPGRLQAPLLLSAQPQGSPISG